MNSKDILGHFSISGSNQNGEIAIMEHSLAFDQNKRIMARWIINMTKFNKGTGFLEIIFLVINFNYEGEGQIIFKGVVVYRCITRMS
jgi:hypothetical protein